MTQPLVSIIIPAYNKAAWTTRTVESVLEQTYPNIEIIVVDDGSSDDTRLEMEKFGNRIRYVYKDNGGASSARNHGFKLSRGAIVGFLDCDDLYLPQKVEKTVAYFQKRPELGAVHSAAYFIDEREKTLGVYSHPQSRKEGWITDRLIQGNFICNSTVLLKRECLQSCGAFDESTFCPADWDLWLRVSEKYQIGFINEPLAKYRVTDNYILRNLQKARSEELAVLHKYFDRQKDVAKNFKKRVFSNFSLRYAQAALVNNDIVQAKREFADALRMSPGNLKALLMFAYFLVGRKSLTAKLNRRIKRCPPGETKTYSAAAR